MVRERPLMMEGGREKWSRLVLQGGDGGGRVFRGPAWVPTRPHTGEGLRPWAGGFHSHYPPLCVEVSFSEFFKTNTVNVEDEGALLTQCPRSVAREGPWGSSGVHEVQNFSCNTQVLLAYSPVLFKRITP